MKFYLKPYIILKVTKIIIYRIDVSMKSEFFREKLKQKIHRRLKDDRLFKIIHYILISFVRIK